MRWTLLIAIAGAALACASDGGEAWAGTPPLDPGVRTASTARAAGLAAAQDPEGWSPDPALGPAVDPLPPAPSADVDGPEPPPGPRALPRNESTAGRFTVAGRRCLVSLDAEAGELVLLELFTYGYTRGWWARGRLTVTGPDRAQLVDHPFESGATGRVLLPFVAPATGRYVATLRAEEEFFRFVLVRHSNYLPAGDGRVAAGAAERVRGWLAGPDDVRRVTVEVAAGEALALALKSARSFALEEVREVARARREGGATMMRGGGGLYPTFSFALPGERPTAFAFLPPGPARTLELEVRARGDVGDFFDLAIERDPALVTARGVVIDAEDRPLDGVRLTFLREPDDELLGAVTTGSDGAYEIALLPGAYRVRLEKGRARREVRTTAWRDRELSFVMGR